MVPLEIGRFPLFAPYLRASVLALGLGLIAMPAFAADTMAGPSCSPDAVHTALQTAGSKLSSTAVSDNLDKDYASAMVALMKTEHELNAWEMKCGTDAHAKTMASDTQKKVDAVNLQYTNFLFNRT